MTAISCLSSMATKGWLAELASDWRGDVNLRAIGGVEAARLVRTGERVDVVLLASGAMRALEAEGALVPGSLHAVAVSDMVVAVRDGAAFPDLADAAATRGAVLAARRVGYSTGPSGDHLLRLLESWGVREALGERLVQAPPGVPVGRLLAEGAVDLAFQQRSEFMGIAGVAVAGPLPAPIGLQTVFTAGIARAAPNPQDGQGFIDFLAAPAASETKQRHGMQPG